VTPSTAGIFSFKVEAKVSSTIIILNEEFEFEVRIIECRISGIHTEPSGTIFYISQLGTSLAVEVKMNLVH
jgi:hypothetical protein